MPNSFIAAITAAMASLLASSASRAVSASRMTLSDSSAMSGGDRRLAFAGHDDARRRRRLGVRRGGWQSDGGGKRKRHDCSVHEGLRCEVSASGSMPRLWVDCGGRRLQADPLSNGANRSPCDGRNVGTSNTHVLQIPVGALAQLLDTSRCKAAIPEAC